MGYGGEWSCPEDMPVGVAAIGYGFPSVKSTSNFIDINPAPAGGYGILNQFVKNLKLANLVAGRPTPIASASSER